MSRKKVVRGIKRISAAIIIAVMVIGIGSIISKIWSFMRLPIEFHLSTEAYHTVYGGDRERLKTLDEIAQEMGYENFNDYRIRRW